MLAQLSRAFQHVTGMPRMLVITQGGVSDPLLLAFEMEDIEIIMLASHASFPTGTKAIWL